jgi:hypothetical protein
MPRDHTHQVRGLSRRLGALGYGVVAWNETVSGREGVRQLERAAQQQQKKKSASGAAGDALWLATQVRPPSASSHHHGSPPCISYLVNG